MTLRAAFFIAMPKTKRTPLFAPLKASYSDQRAESLLRERGYVKDKQLSGKRDQVFYNPETNRTFVTVRGTASVTDALINDPAVAAGFLKSTTRYKHAQNTYDKAANKYSGSSITVGGHSLGGAIASHLNTRSEDRVVTYNKASAPRFLIGEDRNAVNELHYRNPGDIISVFSAAAPRTVNVGAPHLNPLSSHSVDALEHLPVFV